jgi:hypothetical protein
VPNTAHTLWRQECLSAAGAVSPAPLGGVWKQRRAARRRGVGSPPWPPSSCRSARCLRRPPQIWSEIWKKPWLKTRERLPPSSIWEVSSIRRGPPWGRRNPRRRRTLQGGAAQHHRRHSSGSLISCRCHPGGCHDLGPRPLCLLSGSLRIWTERPSASGIWRFPCRRWGRRRQSSRCRSLLQRGSLDLWLGKKP